jgi:precorrin-6Y C5,15-methyltransferase (decarboxylating)
MLSIHGRADDRKEVLRRIISSPESFVLLSGPEDVRILGNALEENLRGDCRIILGRQLSYPDETVISLTAAQCAEVTEPGLYIAYIRHECSADKPLVPVIPDSGFIRGKVPMTKENIRHLSIIRLGLTENSVLYDIGSGTGSVACEAARLSSSVKVYAVEMKEEACGLIAQNAEQFGLDNVEVIQGTAPEALAGLEPPTHVFIGGSSGRLRVILRALRNKNSRIRTVINAVSIETMAEIQSVVDDPDITDMIIEQISVSRSRELGNYHLMTAENPVMIASFVIGGAK